MSRWTACSDRKRLRALQDELNKVDPDRRTNTPMIQFLLTLWHFVRAIRRGLADPEFRSLCVLVLIVIGSGTLFYHSMEGMGWVDALYFCVITLTTVGYGDLAPQTPVGKLFTIVYIFVGLGLLAAFIGYVAQQARENVQENGVLPKLRGKLTADENTTSQSPNQPIT